MKDSHIARWFFIIFTVYFIQPFSLSSAKLCSGNASVCFRKVCQVQTTSPTKNWELKKGIQSKAVQVFTVSCETLMNTLPFNFEFYKPAFWTLKRFFYLPDIHSPPYIQLITPPPNAFLF
ncbi:hypothetical protein [Flavobacterium sp. JP2137]|uniref:hypothetical protein n=1 Tax=Flavobacterium sp. JP2137 TaxID=3414510 RepID=UPI003D2FCEB0